MSEIKNDWLFQFFGTLVGEASLTWEPRPEGVFDTANAARIAKTAYVQWRPLIDALNRLERAPGDVRAQDDCVREFQKLRRANG